MPVQCIGGVGANTPIRVVFKQFGIQLASFIITNLVGAGRILGVDALPGGSGAATLGVVEMIAFMPRLSSTIFF